MEKNNELKKGKNLEEKNEERKNILGKFNEDNKKVILSISFVVLILLLVGVIGFSVYKISRKDKMDNDLENTEKKVMIKQKELTKIEKFINEKDNKAYVLMEYQDPDNILTENNIKLLLVSLSESIFSKKATTGEIDVIGKENVVQGVAMVSTLEDIDSYIKEKTNHEIVIDKIKSAFSSRLNNQLGLYYYVVSPSNDSKYEIKNGYKIGNDYYITLKNKSELILNYANDRFYFRSHVSK